MMEKFDIFINKICNKINDMIPEEWNKVYIYGEVTEGAGVVAFYYYPQDKDIYVFSADIIDLFDIDENEFSTMNMNCGNYLNNFNKNLRIVTKRFGRALLFI